MAEIFEVAVRQGVEAGQAFMQDTQLNKILGDLYNKAAVAAKKEPEKSEPVNDLVAQYGSAGSAGRLNHSHVARLEAEKGSERAL